jgi:hypothetical protein
MNSRIATALERIADALERQAKPAPLKLTGGVLPRAVRDWLNQEQNR